MSEYRFTCRACGYAADVAGEVTTDFLVRTATVVCLDCRELHDVEVARRDSTAVPYGPSAEICCPADCDHDVRSWTHPGACPQCAAPGLDRRRIGVGVADLERAAPLLTAG